MRTIREIDRDITATRKQLRALEPIGAGLSAAVWQDAWDKHPDLRAQECALFRERGEAQRELAEAEHARYMQARRKRS